MKIQTRYKPQIPDLKHHLEIESVVKKRKNQKKK